MVDRYWREIEDVENDIENAMKISSILLKHKVYDKKLEGLSKIDTNENNISSNSGLISTNKSDIASNLSKINNIENDIKISNEIYNETFVILNSISYSRSEIIFEKIINLNFTKNGIIKINTNCNYIYDEKYNFKHIYYFYNNDKVFKKISLKNDRVSNVVKDEFEFESVDSTSIKILIYLLDNSDYKKIELFGNNTIQIIYNEISDVSSNLGKINNNKSDIVINSELISTNTNSISDNSGLISTNTNSISDNSGLISTNTNSISTNSGLISTNTNSISANSGLIETNTSSISSNKGLIDTNTSNISDNSGLISMNTSNISDNLKKINNNKNDIISLQTSNVKAFYNLDQIFIYDIEKGNQTVNKDNHFHIFEKEIIYNFTKNSYLEIALKVLTEISNYVLIGFFQILCNFYDQDNNLFYTISLSTAMGSINKLSTIKSVFIVPINENMSKIKIDFLLHQKKHNKIGQQDLLFKILTAIKYM